MHYFKFFEKIDMHLTDELKLFLGSLNLGLFLAVSGDTPMALLMHFGLSSGP